MTAFGESRRLDFDSRNIATRTAGLPPLAAIKLIRCRGAAVDPKRPLVVAYTVPIIQSLLPYSEIDHMSVLACFPALRTIPAVLNRWNRPESHS